MEKLIAKMVIAQLTKAEQKAVLDELQARYTTVTKVKSKVPSKFYTRTDKVLAASQTLPKQAKILLEVLPTDKLIDIDAWTELALKAGLETKQEPVRITMYYRPTLIAGGFITESK